MSITREEANKCLKSLMRVLITKEGDKYRPAKDTSRQDAYRALYEIQEALGTSRIERQVERMRGEWMFPIFADQEDANDPRCQCSECGSIETPLARHRFCPFCGAPMTDEAVDIELRRWGEAVGNA